MFAYLNGTYLPRASATVSVEDRGFIFGDGVYEVWRAVNGRLFELHRHLDRLLAGLAALRISAPDIVRPRVLSDVAEHLLSQSGLMEGEATLYLQITRGSAPRAHGFPVPATAPTVYLTVNRITPPEKLRLQGTLGITVPDVRWLRCDLKTLQLLPNVMAKQAAIEVGAADALLVRDGLVTEGSHTNVIGVIDGAIRTHPANNFILAGITRAVVLDVARSLDIPVHEAAFGERDIPRLEELFLTGTTTDILPLVRVNHQVIGNGLPGPITERLITEFRVLLDAACTAGDELRPSSTLP